MNNSELDMILKNALSLKVEPDERLNRRILMKAKETENMKIKQRLKVQAALLIGVLTLSIGSVTAYAAWKYLSPENVAEKTGDAGLEAAFATEDAIALNESQTYGDYKITLLGVISGKGLSSYLASDENGELHDDRTYVVTAIENINKTDENAEDVYDIPFFVSPLIKGLNPGIYNSVTMNGGYNELFYEGVRYRISECDTVEVFADRGLYLCVTDTVFYDSEAFNYDESTGEISRNEAYEGVNALFNLPLDKGKSDTNKAQKYIDEFEQKWNSPDKDSEYGLNEIDKYTPEYVKQLPLIEESVQILTPDNNGMINYTYSSDNGMMVSGSIPLNAVFEDGKPGMSEQMEICSSGEGEPAWIETFTLNEDGTVTCAIYLEECLIIQ